jgi:hypothetical protein
MNKFWIVFFVFISLFSFASEEEEGQFTLPDLFVTARDERSLDSAYKINSTYKQELSINDKIIDGSLYKDRNLIDDIIIDNIQMTSMYNDLSLFLGLPSFYEASLNHGYLFSNIPYFLSLSFFNKYSFFRDRYNGNKLFFTLNPDKQNTLSLYQQSRQLENTDLSLLGVGFNSDSNFPFSYALRLFSSNPFAGNASLQILQHNLNLNFKEQNIFNRNVLPKLSFMYLGSNNNSFLAIDFLAKNLFEIANNKPLLGLQFWNNKNISKLALLFDYNQPFTFNELALNLNVNYQNEKIDIDTLFNNYYYEMNDSVLRCNEKFSLSVSVNNVFKKLDETVFVNLNYYNNLNILDDTNLNNYYSYNNISDVLIMNIGAYFPDLMIASESINVKLSYPLVSKKITNLFSKFLEVSFEKDIFSGKFNAKGNYYLKELGRSSDNSYKNGFFDIDLSYDQVLDENFSFGLYLENLLSAGNTYLPGRNFGETILYGKIKFIL